jgi:hypothetical protein
MGEIVLFVSLGLLCISAAIGVLVLVYLEYAEYKRKR